MSDETGHQANDDILFDDLTVQSERVGRVGAVIGRYKLLEQIGEGGFGVVYRAEQREPVRRDVALKIIKLGMDTREVIARFEAERQALALMDHPNIATVLDGGATDTGRPYFVMELVRGDPITYHCDRHNLSTEERLHLFMDVCHAVQHAHQKGVIHRDIKPANVLVSLSGNNRIPKVIDFGIAKATSAELTEKTIYTQQRQLIGTPEYMSPEQAEMTGLDIDTRSDVYSLGVLLYELLTGTTPFSSEGLRSAALSEIQRIIREEDPPRPSTRISTLGASAEDVARHRRESADHLARQLRGDLDWIVMKAIEKDRTRRYETVNGLAADIRRHLDSEPVMASPPSSVYRLKKLVVRHRGAFTAAAIVMFVLVAGLIATGAALAWALDEQQRANTAAAQAEIDATTARRTSEFLVTLFEASDPSEAGADPPTAHDLLDLGAQRLAELDDEPATQAALRESIGMVYLALGRFAEARPLLQAALDYRADFTDAEGELAYADVLGAMANLHDITRELDDAETKARKVVEIRRRLLGESPELAGALNTLGNVQWHKGDLPGAEVIHREALAIRDRLFSEPNAATAQSLHNLGALSYLQGDLIEAESLYIRSIEIDKVVAGPDDPSLATSMHTLSFVYLDQRKLEDALRLQEQALDIRTRVMGEQHWHTALSLNTKGDILRELDRAAEAEPLHRAAMAIVEPVWDEAHDDLGWMRRSHAETLIAMGRYDDATELMRREVAIQEDAKSIFVAPGLVLLGKAVNADGQGDADEAIRIYTRAVELAEGGVHGQALAGLAGLQSDADTMFAMYRAAAAELANEYGDASVDRLDVLLEMSTRSGSTAWAGDIRPEATELTRLVRASVEVEHPGSMQLEFAARVFMTVLPEDLRDPAAALAFAKRAVVMNPRSDRVRETQRLAMEAASG